MMSPRRLLHTFLLAAFGCAVAPNVIAAQQPVGTVTGRVTDKGTGQPVPSAQVFVVGGSSAALTNADGQFTLRNVPAGPVMLRTLRIGYSENRQPTTVVARQSVTLNFEMTAVPASLSAVVTTATGNQRRVEVGNAIAQVNASEITAKATITNVGDLLNSRAAGVDVFGATQPGAGIRIRIRGTSSMALSNNPIFVIDGIRVDASTGSSKATRRTAGATRARPTGRGRAHRSLTASIFCTQRLAAASTSSARRSFAKWVGSSGGRISGTTGT